MYKDFFCSYYIYYLLLKNIAKKEVKLLAKVLLV